MPLITPGTITDLSPDTYAVHPFDAMTTSMVNLAGTITANTNLSDRAKLSVSYTESARSAVAVVPEGDPIAETKTIFKSIEVPSVKLAVLKSASNEVLNHNNVPGESTGTRISLQALQDLRDAADAAVFGVNGPTVDGLTSLPLDQNVTDLGDLSDNLDWLADALANILDGGGKEQDTLIVASPKAQSALLKLKDSGNGNRPLIDTLSGTSDYAVPNATGLATTSSVPVRNLAGIPVMVSRHLTDPGTDGAEFYVIDRPNLLVAATPAVMATSSDAMFDRDSVAFRGTLRIGWKLARPERVSRITIPTTTTV